MSCIAFSRLIDCITVHSEYNDDHNEHIIVMNKRIPTTAKRFTLMIGTTLLALAATGNFGYAYETYSGGEDGGCIDCHGDFDGPTSPKGVVFPSNSKHTMHNGAANMGTACMLCHTDATQPPVYTGSSTGTANNPGLGCSGCHVGSGLREHHFNNGITLCYGCHSYQTPPAENVSPPYYGTVDTKARNPGNTVQAANTNENWSVGDYLGLDNDGNNLYDLADFAVGPYRILSTKTEGSNIRITWLTAGGRKDAVQAAAKAAGPYTNVSLAITIPGVGLVTTNYLDVNAALNSARYYRLHYMP
jgi:hypothetical protein